MSSFAICMKTNVASLDLIFIGTNNANPNLILTFDKWKFSTAPIIDRQLSHKKNSSETLSYHNKHMKTKHELKCQNELFFNIIKIK